MPNKKKGNTSGWSKQPQRLSAEDIKAIDNRLTQQRQDFQNQGRRWQNNQNQDSAQKSKQKTDTDNAKNQVDQGQAKPDNVAPLGNDQGLAKPLTTS